MRVAYHFTGRFFHKVDYFTVLSSFSVSTFRKK